MKKKYFEVAKRLRHFSDHPKHKLGAVLVYKNKVLGLGFNKNKTSPKANHVWKHLHAEDVVLTNAYRHHDNVAGSTLYLYRENKNGDLANSRPCGSCMKTIKDAGVKKICYTIDGIFFEEKLND